MDATTTASEEQIFVEPEMSNTSDRKLMDSIPIFCPELERELLKKTSEEKRFLDFLKATPSREWFHKVGFRGRILPFLFIRRSGGLRGEQPSQSVSQSTLAAAIRQRFRVPFVRKINWEALVEYCKEWIKHPMNMAFLVWLMTVAACLLILLLVASGLLNHAIPQSSQRKKWTEVNNQILNALFTIMCLYQHPKLGHHFVLLCRWASKDIAELRKIYCKHTTGRPYERAHMMFVVVLLNITCFSQYALCGLYWGYSRSKRPDIGENLCIGVGTAAPLIASVYMVYGPLGRKYKAASSSDEESQQGSGQYDFDVKVLDRRLVVARPQWVGGLFDCWDDLTVAYLSFFCTFCVFGWNMERLGFGNMYVHIITFILLCMAPFWVFNVAGLNIKDDVIRYVIGIFGIVLCFFGLLYGGFWRTQMRKRFKLPANKLCCGYAAFTDFMIWLFCWSCSLAQEVRTGNYYDIEEDSFYNKLKEESERPALVPLAREGCEGSRDVNTAVSGRSQSCHGNSVEDDPLRSGQSGEGGDVNGDKHVNDGDEYSMVAPVPMLIDVEGTSRQH